MAPTLLILAVRAGRGPVADAGPEDVEALSGQGTGEEQGTLAAAMHADAGPRRALFIHETTFQPGDVDLDAPGALAEVHRRLALDENRNIQIVDDVSAPPRQGRRRGPRLPRPGLTHPRRLTPTPHARIQGTRLHPDLNAPHGASVVIQGRASAPPQRSRRSNTDDPHSEHGGSRKLNAATLADRNHPGILTPCPHRI